ncbi:UNVERIFIED_CONTAM: hypothetical protein K2H54_063968 [Gekko kuhli]
MVMAERRNAVELLIPSLSYRIMEFSAEVRIEVWRLNNLGDPEGIMACQLEVNTLEGEGSTRMWPEERGRSTEGRAEGQHQLGGSDVDPEKSVLVTDKVAHLPPPEEIGQEPGRAPGKELSGKYKANASEADWEVAQKKPAGVKRAMAQENLPGTQTQEQAERSNSVWRPLVAIQQPDNWGHKGVSEDKGKEQLMGTETQGGTWEGFPLAN